MLHDANKRLIKVSDIYPEFADLKKGEYTIRLQLRHDDAALLDKMKDVPVVVERKLKEPVMVPVYATVRDAVKAAKPVKERSLYAGKLYSIWLSTRNLEALQCQFCGWIWPGWEVSSRSLFGRSSCLVCMLCLRCQLVKEKTIVQKEGVCSVRNMLHNAQVCCCTPAVITVPL